MSARAGSEAPSVIVVTSTPHVARTRYIFAKCYPGEFTVVAAEQPDTLAEWAHAVRYQSIAFGKALVEPCPDAASTRLTCGTGPSALTRLMKRSETFGELAARAVLGLRWRWR